LGVLKGGGGKGTLNKKIDPVLFFESWCPLDQVMPRRHGAVFDLRSKIYCPKLRSAMTITADIYLVFLTLEQLDLAYTLLINVSQAGKPVKQKMHNAMCKFSSKAMNIGIWICTCHLTLI
jgi:hypothetical protein